MDYYNLQGVELYTYIYNRKCKYHEYIDYHTNGNRCEWTLGIDLHNTRGPAIIVISLLEKNLYQKRYYKFGVPHNSNGPAYTFYYENGVKSYELYYINGKLHNSNGPADIIYYIDGQKHQERYFDNGVLHNNNGPAIIIYNNGDREVEEYWIHGNRK